MLNFKKSRLGIFFVFSYLVLAIVVFGSHIYSVKTNPADSGESAIGFYLLGLPWNGLLSLLPNELVYSRVWDLLAYPLGWTAIILNAFVVYCLTGGVSFRK